MCRNLSQIFRKHIVLILGHCIELLLVVNRYDCDPPLVLYADARDNLRFHVESVSETIVSGMNIAIYNRLKEAHVERDHA